MYYVNKDVASMKRVLPMQGRGEYLRLDMNENPEGLPKEFIEKVLKNVTPEFLSTYPEPDKFLSKYASFVGVNFENVLTTNGSDMAIRYLLEIFGEKGKNVVTVSPTFEMYWVNCCLLGLNHIPVYYENDLTISVDKIIDAINDDTRIVVVLNPNNPVGDAFAENDLKKIILKAKQVNAIVIIDEAYHYFYDKTFLNYVFENDNVVLLRTFSKLMSLAACRLGVIISNPKIIEYVKTLRLTFEANSFALLFGEKIIENPQIIEELIKIEKDGKKHLLTELKNKGYECKDSNGNFVFIKTKKDPHQITKKLKDEKKILVHDYKHELLKDYIRITTGSKEVMQKFIDALFELDLS